MIVFHLLTFIESNLQRREYHFVNEVLSMVSWLECWVLDEIS